MRRIDALVVHCSATRPSQDIGAAEIRRWHTSPSPDDPSKPWSDIGYHRVIRRDGTVEPGRRDERAGAHVGGHNSNTLAVCLVGGVAEDGRTPEDNFTPEQKAALLRVLLQWRQRFPQAAVKGHRDFPGVRKACPSFDVPTWWREVHTNHVGTAL